MNDFGQCPTEGAIGLLALLIRSSRLAEASLDEALAGVGLTFGKWRALDSLMKADAGIALGLLAEQLNCVKSNVTQLVDRLEAEGMVKRAADREDRRSTLVQLTDRGRDFHGRGLAALESATRKLFQAFTEQDRDELRWLLGRLEKRQP